MSRESAKPEGAPVPAEQMESEEPFVREFQNLLAEGWAPDVEEYLARVPDAVREPARERIELLLAVHAEAARHEGAEPPRPRVLQIGDEAFAPRAWDELESTLGEEGLAPDAHELVLLDASAMEDADASEAATDTSTTQEEVEQAPDVADASESETDTAVELAEGDEAADAVQAIPAQAEGLPEVDGYRLDVRLGQGPRGTVYGAWDETRKRRVAVKVLAFEPGEDFLEAVARASGADPEGIAAFDTLVEGNIVVGELVEGQPLDAACGQRDMLARARLLERVACALASAHAVKVVHGAVKPTNILVGEEGLPRLVDLALPPSPARDAENLYAAPEEIQSRLGGPAADVFSLGTVMYHVLTGRLPFPREDQIPDADPPFPRTIDPAIPQDLQAVCLACLARNPRARPTAAEVADSLQRFLEGREVLLRPVRIATLLRRQIKEHGAQLREWAEVGAISEAELDHLDAHDRRILRTEEEWTHDRHRITVEQALVALAAVAAAASALLTAWFAPAASLVGSLLPVVAASGLLLLGVRAWRRRDWMHASTLLAGASFAAVPAVIAGLGAAGVLARVAQGFGPLQIGAGLLGGLAVAGGAWALLRQPLFAWLTAAFGAATVCAGAAVLGIADRPVFQQALLLSPLVSFAVVGWLCERGRRVRWGLPFHLVGFGTLAILPVWMALRGALPGDLLPGWTDPRAVAVALHGLLLYVVQAALARAADSGLRRAGRVLALLAPAFVLCGLFANAWLHPQSAAGALHAVGVLLVLGAAVRRRSRSYLALGGLGLALGCYLPFAGSALDPVLLGAALLGIAAFSAGLAILRARSRALRGRRA